MTEPPLDLDTPRMLRVVELVVELNEHEEREYTLTANEIVARHNRLIQYARGKDAEIASLRERLDGLAEAAEDAANDTYEERTRDSIMAAIRAAKGEKS